MKSLAKNSIFNFLYTLLNLLFPLISSIYVSRILLSAGVGKVAYAQSIANYFLTFASLGIQSYGIREISRVRTDPVRKNRVFTQLVVFNVVSTSLSLLLYGVLVGVMAKTNVEIQLFSACGLVVFFNFFNIDWFYQGEEEYVYIVCKNIVIKTISILALFIFVKTKEDYLNYAWIQSIAAGANHILNILHARKMVHLDVHDFKFISHLKPIAVFGAGALIATIYSKVDITLLGILTDEHHVGYYSYGHKIVELVLAAISSFTSIFLPRLCFLYASDRTAFSNMVQTGLRLLCLLAFPIAAGLFILAPEIIVLLFGPDFLPSASVIRWFTPILFTNSFGNLLCWQLSICTGNERLRVPAAFAGSIINIILNLILIPHLQEIGAVIASVISELIVNGYQIEKLRKVVSMRLPGDAFRQAVLGSIIMCIPILAVQQLIYAPWPRMILSVFIGVLTYFAASYIMRNKLMLQLIEKAKTGRVHF